MAVTGSNLFWQGTRQRLCTLGVQFFLICHRNWPIRNNQKLFFYVVKIDQTQMFNDRVTSKGKMLLMVK